MDQKTINRLLDAATSAKEHHEMLRAKQGEKAWKTVDLPCDLYLAINNLTKNEMDTIRKNYNLKGISSLKKLELVKELAHQIPDNFTNILYLLDDERYNLVKKIVNQSSITQDTTISFEKLSVLRDYSLVFLGKVDNENVIYMPTELIGIFKEADGPKLKSAVKRNSEWIKLTHGMAYYYGVVDRTYLITQIEKLVDTEMDYMNFFETISFASKYYRHIRVTYSGYVDHRIFNPSEIIEAHKARPSIDHKLFTKDQLIAAAEEFYFEKNKTMMTLLKFFKDHYEISNFELDEVALQLEYLIKTESPPSLLIEYLESVFEFPTFEFVQNLTHHLMELNNNTRMWILKGHTPNEIRQTEKNFLAPLPVRPFNSTPEKNNVVQMSDYKKTGRNEPCPCGSGKKYKKCCKK